MFNVKVEMYLLKRYISIFSQIIMTKNVYVNVFFTKKITTKRREWSGLNKMLPNYSVFKYVIIGTIA